MRYRDYLILLAAVVAGGVACGNSTGYGGGGGGNPPTGDVLIVSGAQGKGAQAFDPNPFTVALNGGASVNIKFANQDGLTHNIRQDGASPTFEHSFGGGSTFTFTFTTAGTYNYHCTIHPTMVGSLTVNP